MTRLKRCAAVILAMALLMAGAARAEVRKGDMGDEVYRLQTLLLECGWLFELPDGEFGARTEEALKQYQRFAGLPEDGVATEEVMARLRADRAALFGEADGSADGAGGYASLAHCLVTLEDGMTHTEYCAAHRAIFEQDQLLQIDGSTEAMRQAEEMWQTAVDDLYADWISRAAPEEKLAALAALTGWKGTLEAQRSVFEAIYPQDEGMVHWEMIHILKARATLLCGMGADRDADENVGE